MPKWDGAGYSETPNQNSRPSNASTGGCSGLGIDSQGQFGLVYKATENTGGIYRTFTRQGESHQQYVRPVHIRHVPTLRKSRDSP